MHSLLIVLSLFLASADKPPPTPTLVVVHGPGCKPCLEMLPLVNRLERDGVRVERIDTAKDEKTARKWKVRVTPTFIAVRGDREVGRIVGKTTLDRLRKLVGREPDQVLPDPKPEKKKPERSVLRRGKR